MKDGAERNWRLGRAFEEFEFHKLILTRLR